MEHITASDLRRIFADVAEGGTYGCFEYQGGSLGLYSDEAALLEWFGKFFGGYFTVTTSRHTDAAVYSSKNPAVFQRLKDWATSSGEPRWEAETEYAVDEQHRIIYSREVYEAKGKVGESCFVLSQPGRNVLVVSPGTLKDRQKTVKRSLRNMMKLLFMERGWLPLHSAACVWNDTGICILGGKFGGKTSTLVNLLVRPGARLVSNDNLFLRDGGTCLEGCGFPNNAALRIGALVAYPRLMDWIDKPTGSFYQQIDAETFRDIVSTTLVEELASKVREDRAALHRACRAARCPDRARHAHRALPGRPIRPLARGVPPGTRHGPAAGQRIPGRHLPQPGQGEAGLPPGLFRFRRRHAAGCLRRAAGEVHPESGGPGAVPEREDERALGGIGRTVDASDA
jgi:hypothetical protein